MLRERRRGMQGGRGGRRGRRGGRGRRRVRVRGRWSLVRVLKRVQARRLREERLRGEKMVGGEVRRLRGGKVGFGVWAHVMVSQVRREGLGAAGGGVRLRWTGHKRRLVVGLGLRGDARLVRVKVQRAQVGEGVQRLGLGRGGRVGREHGMSVREVGGRQERREGGRQHVREVRVGRRERRGEVLGRVLLHVDPRPPRVLRRMHR